ncbi:MAG: hypothetical protein ACIALR_03565, partial [Blastopirellula sp. JB062]
MAESQVPAKKRKPIKWQYVVLVAAIAVAYAIFVYLPRQRHISSLREEISQMKSAIESETAIDIQLATLQTEWR